MRINAARFYIVRIQRWRILSRNPRSMSHREQVAWAVRELRSSPASFGWRRERQVLLCSEQIAGDLVRQEDHFKFAQSEPLPVRPGRPSPSVLSILRQREEPDFGLAAFRRPRNLCDHMSGARQLSEPNPCPGERVIRRTSTVATAELAFLMAIL